MSNVVNLSKSMISRREREARLIGLAGAVTAYVNSVNALNRLYAGSPPHIREWALASTFDKDLLTRHYRTTLAYFAAVARGEFGEPADGWKQCKSDIRFHDQALAWAEEVLRSEEWRGIKQEAMR